MVIPLLANQDLTPMLFLYGVKQRKVLHEIWDCLKGVVPIKAQEEERSSSIIAKCRLRKIPYERP